jgi:hypothetical protein
MSLSRFRGLVAATVAVLALAVGGSSLAPAGSSFAPSNAEARGQVYYYGWVNLQQAMGISWDFTSNGTRWLVYEDWTTGSDAKKYCFNDWWYYDVNIRDWREWGYYNPNGPHPC